MNSAGIFSLAGFIYQIKVFIYYLAELEEGYSIGYETYDDVALQKTDTTIEKQESKLQTYNGIINTNSGITAMQVKHKNLTVEDYEKILFNWIILRNDHSDLQKYILIVDKAYNNQDLTFSENFKSLFNKISSSQKSNQALITKVKNIINGNYSVFEKILNEIKAKYIFKEYENIDKEISEQYKNIFNKGGVENSTYNLRIKELIEKIQSEILDSIVNLNSYKCDYSIFRHMVENINLSIRDDRYLPSFSDFKKQSKLDLKQLGILNSRQYIQLSKCNLPNEIIKEHLIFEEYYNSYKLRNLENLNVGEINDIEETAHYNFAMTKIDLINNSKDTPSNRLHGTLNKENSYTPNEQIKFGTAIHLTKADTEKTLLISWEDD